MNRTFLVLYRLSASLLLGGAVSACAAGGTSDDPSDGTGGSATSGTGGTGVGGDASGGSGGSGEGLCEQDCSLLETPPCLVSVCNDGQYPGEVGACTVVNAQTGTACDDGVFCTVDDFCDAGSCMGGPTNDCGQTPSVCNEIVCDEDARNCAEAPASDGSSCTSPDLCDVNATCQAGQCIGTPKDCTFAPVGECNTAVCNPANGMCEGMIDPTKNGDACSLSGNLCNVGKTCNEGQCIGGTPKDCSALTMGCNNGVCDMVTGDCVADPVPAGGACSDGVGVCELGTCDMNGTCVVTIDNGGACDDGDAGWGSASEPLEIGRLGELKEDASPSKSCNAIQQEASHDQHVRVEAHRQGRSPEGHRPESSRAPSSAARRHVRRARRGGTRGEQRGRPQPPRRGVAGSGRRFR